MKREKYGPFFACGIGVLVYLTALLLPVRCSSVPVEPSPENPRVACIAKTPFAPFQKASPNGSRLLPEIVRVIGKTSPEDGERWKVVRGIYFADKCAGELVNDLDSCEWLPFAQAEIQFVGCGPEADSIRYARAE